MSPAVVEKEKVHSSVKPGAQEKEWASACVGARRRGRETIAYDEWCL